jgi:glycosyltransferase involved in cell wall biosynthesis
MKLLRHTVFNLIGLGAPLLVAVGTIPVLIHELGPSRFGLLTLIWAVVSYFGLFDLGLGRALTQQLAVVFENNEHKKVGPLVGTATVLMAMLGVMAGVLMAAAASWGVGLIHDVPDRQEAVNAVYAMALAMPFIVLTSGFRGILEARHAFGIVNLIRLPMGLFTFLGPVVVVLYGGGPRLDYIAWVLVAGRVIACVVHSYYAWRVLPKERSVIIFRIDLVRPLCISGGWMTISNIVGPLMGYLDRFVVGAFASAEALAYYATPQELISKLSVVPSALMAVLFPQFAKISMNFCKVTIETLERAASLAEYIVQTPSMQRAVSQWYAARDSSQAPVVRVLPFVNALPNPIERDGLLPEWDFVYVADGEAHKNHRVLVEAWQLLAQDGLHPSLALTLSHRDAVLKRELEALAAEDGLRIKDLGQMTHENVLSLYATAKAMIFPSTSESFGLPLIEARHLGLPILASELDYVRDVCSPVHTFDPTSAVSIARAVKRFLEVPEPALRFRTPQRPSVGTRSACQVSCIWAPVFVLTSDCPRCRRLTDPPSWTAIPRPVTNATVPHWVTRNWPLGQSDVGANRHDHLRVFQSWDRTTQLRHWSRDSSLLRHHRGS